MFSILQEQPTYLASEAWRTIPWNGEHKDDLHLLIDILANIPAFLALSNSIAASSHKSSSTTKRTERMQHIRYELDAALDIWHSDLVKTRQGSPFCYSSARNSHEQSPFSTYIEFKCIADAQVMLFYWMAKLMLSNGSLRVQRFLESQRFGRRVIEEGEAITLAGYADSICQSMGWCLRSTNGVLGLQLSTLPLRVATQFYQSCNLVERENWCTQVINTTMKQQFALVAG